MKRVALIVLGLLLCLAVFVLPAAAEDATEPEPSAQTQEEPAAPVFQPEIDTALLSLYDAWKTSEHPYGKGSYDRAFRKLYAIDPDVTILDHVVYLKMEGVNYAPRYYVIDFFDSDEAEAAGGTLRIRSSIDGVPVGGVYMCYHNMDMDPCGSVFENNTVTEVVLEEGLQTIGDFAFSDFTALQTVSLPASMTSISRSAFCNCTRLNKVTVGGALTAIGARAFENCKKLRSFDGLENVERLEGRAFAGSGLRSVTLHGNVLLAWGDEDIDPIGYTFAGCKALKTVIFTDGDAERYLEIARGCFADCTALRTVTLPTVCGSITIDENAFSGCTALKAVQKVTKLKRVYSKAFQGCTALDTFVLPKGIEFAETDAFAGCSGLTRFFVNSKNPNLLKYKDFDDGDFRVRMITGNFLASLPKTCTIFVKNREMKGIFKSAGFPGTVKISVSVAAPKTVRATKQNGKVTLKWSKVTMADGYRVWSYNPKTGKYTKLATVKAPKTSIAVKSNAKQFAVRAYRVEAGDVSWSAIKAFQ